MRRLLLAAVLLVSFAAPARAQLIFRQPHSLSAVPSFQLWEQSKDSVSETLSQFALPLSLFYPLGEAGELSLSGYFAHSRYAGLDRNGSFGALGDVQLDYVNDFWQDRAAYTLSVNLPTGTAKLSPDEFFITEQIASPLLPFRVKHLGQGVGASGAVAYTGGTTWLYGASLRGTYRGTYKPIVDGPDYRPGPSLDIIVEAHSDASHLALDAVGTLYGNDKLNDTAVFRDGPQLDMGVTWQPVAGLITHSVSARVILRSKDKRRDSTGTLQSEPENSNGTDLRFGYSVTRPVAKAWLGRLGVNFKHLGANGYSIDSLRYRGSGDLFGVALDLSREIGQGTFRVGSTAFVGSAKQGNRLNLAAPDERISIKGIEMRLGYAWRW